MCTRSQSTQCPKTCRFWGRSGDPQESRVLPCSGCLHPKDFCIPNLDGDSGAWARGTTGLEQRGLAQRGQRTYGPETRARTCARAHGATETTQNLPSPAGWGAGSRPSWLLGKMTMLLQPLRGGRASPPSPMFPASWRRKAGQRGSKALGCRGPVPPSVSRLTPCGCTAHDVQAPASVSVTSSAPGFGG